MAVDSTTAFRNVSEQTAIPLPPDELVPTQSLADQLQITDAEALKPGNLVPFLARQSVRYNEIANRPEIKTSAGDIPEYLFDDRAPIVTALSQDEQSALSDWRNQAKTMLSSQSDTGTGADGLEQEIQQFVDDALKNNPDALAGGHSMGAVDVMGDMMTGELYRETAEAKKRYEEILATAKDAESVILAMTWKQSQKTAQLMGRAFEALRFQQDGLMKLEAQASLNGKNPPNQAELMKTNMDFAKFSSDSSQIYQIIQKGTSDYERNFAFGNSMIKSSGEAEKTMIQNLKS